MYSYVPGFSEEKFHTVRDWYDRFGVWVLFFAAFTPLPFKIFTVAGGVFDQNLPLFILVSLVGRGLRFYLVAMLFWWVGPRAIPFIDRYFNWFVPGRSRCCLIAGVRGAEGDALVCTKPRPVVALNTKPRPRVALRG